MRLLLPTTFENTRKVPHEAARPSSPKLLHTMQWYNHRSQPETFTPMTGKKTKLLCRRMVKRKSSRFQTKSFTPWLCATDDQNTNEG